MTTPITLERTAVAVTQLPIPYDNLEPTGECEAGGRHNWVDWPAEPDTNTPGGVHCDECGAVPRARPLQTAISGWPFEAEAGW